jgi:twitching motility protein PilU
LTNADSPTNLSWLINNSEITGIPQREETRNESPLDFAETSVGGTSFKEFTLSLNDAQEEQKDVQ